MSHFAETEETQAPITEGEKERDRGKERERERNGVEKRKELWGEETAEVVFLILQNQLGKKKLEMHTHSSYAQAGRHTNPTPVDLVSREGIFCFCLCLKVLKFKAAAIASCTNAFVKLYFKFIKCICFAGGAQGNFS